MRRPSFSGARLIAAEASAATSTTPEAAAVSAGQASMSATFAPRKRAVIAAPIEAPVTVRCTVFTADRRMARSPLENRRKNVAGAPITRSSTAACMATDVRASKRAAATARSRSSRIIARPAAASPATSAAASEPEPAGMAR